MAIGRRPPIYITLRDLPVNVATQNASPAEKLDAIRRASAVVAGSLRLRHELPLRPQVEDFAVASAAGSASLAGQPEYVADVVVRVATGGVVGVDSVTVEVSEDGGTTYGDAVALDADGSTPVDGVTVSVAGTVVAGESLSYSTRVDALVREAVLSQAVYLLVTEVGSDPEGVLTAVWQKRSENAAKLMTSVVANEVKLPRTEDSTPTKDDRRPRWRGTKPKGYGL